ncbi:glycoprotein 3-alpha-L-fucosyltransferase A [Rhipicephalus sanguineus]|uniref:Fucosyltransferase n=1 Tax=Rhipicephalus sanguineus TaxID=34632 RepID=A0A9D4Q816_RHISA|nr:glycoprotein 3-alpha-L-fucosyltransferase A [Rhipicephalus sanguineus]KAH7969640.1 hypothetical protein HPB52_020726 [Rhipicephalus sanguineus]
MLEGPWEDFMDGRRRFLRDQCPVDDCYLYNNYNDVQRGTELAAVVFRGSYSGPSLSFKRKQVWILHLLENPLHTEYIVDEGRGIDWVASYRTDSEIVTPYSKFVLYDPLVKSIRRDYDYVQNKTKMAAWFVSNCETSNKRLEYARKLSEYIEVDVYGACGPHECTRSQGKTCYELLDKDYFFYLSFENANCKDYITEKFFNALRRNVVPVVMGASREEYQAAAPYHSYIHVDDFASPKELAEYLRLLRSNPSLYNEYFEWKGTGEFVNSYFWCRLCAMLHAPPPPPETRRTMEVYRWWKNNACSTVGSSR